jgi:Lon protease-like protein
VMPLHIFEDRYRALTRHCLDTGAPFGVVLIRDGREVGSSDVLTLAGVGAMVEIREAGRYPDGRFDLLAAATGRFSLDAVDPGREPYLVAEVTPLADDIGDAPRAERLAATAIRKFVRYLELMRARDGETDDPLDIQVEIDAGAADDDPPVPAGGGSAEGDIEVVVDAGSRGDLAIPDDPTVLSYLLSGIVQIEVPRRQALLEATTTTARLEALISLLDREIVLLSARLRLFVPDTRLVGRTGRS